MALVWRISRSSVRATESEASAEEGLHLLDDYGGDL
jgi:hypothetical protein